MSPLRAMTPARRAALEERIVRLYVEDGLSGITIGDRIGVHPASVSRIIKARGLTRPIGSHLKPHAHLEPRNARIERLYLDEKLTAQQIADRLGINRSCVKQVLVKRGVPRRQPGSWNPNRPGPRSKAVRAYAERIASRVGTGPGTALADFAPAIGVCVATLSRHLRTLGVKPRFGIGNARLTLDQAVAIKRGLVYGHSFASLARRFLVSDSTINAIALGQSWAHAPWPPGKGYQRRDRTGRPRASTVEPQPPRPARRQPVRAARAVRAP